MTSKIEDEETQSAIVDQWRALAGVIDRLLFWITVLILAAGLIGMAIAITKYYSPLLLD